jgi:CIC family chloride channel protein
VSEWRATEQPNVPPSDENPPLQFWVALGLTGIAAGVGAIVMTKALRLVQHISYNYSIGEFSDAVARTGDARRLLVLAVGGLVTGTGWWLLRRRAGGSGGEPTRSVWSGEGNISLRRNVLSGLLSEVAVGAGASLGREAAPQRTGAAFGSWIGRRMELPANQRVLLVACGAGAGVGAVYNVPFAGALFAVELYLGSLSITTVVPALATSAIATGVAWLALPEEAVYSIPRLPTPSVSLLAFAVVAGPLIGLVSAGWVRVVGWASDHRPTGRMLIVEPMIAFAILGGLAFEYPLLVGNGRDLAQFAFTGNGGLGILLVLAALKPLMTALCLRSGATGGLFTPSFSLGAVLGAAFGHIWAMAWPAPSGVSFAIIGAAAMIAAAMQSPLAAIAFTLELTNSVDLSIVAILLAVIGAVVVSRGVNPQSIYSARTSQPGLPARAAEDLTE